MSKVVAFLQNVWVHDPERLRRIFEREPEIREEMIARLLFMGCFTGGRLTKAFGDLCDEIVWEETTLEIAGNPKTILPAQPEHIREVLARHNPKIVLTFGRIAFEAIKPLWTGHLISLPHPAARQGGIVERLKLGNDELRRMLTV